MRDESGIEATFKISFKMHQLTVVYLYNIVEILKYWTIFGVNAVILSSNFLVLFSSCSVIYISSQSCLKDSSLICLTYPYLAEMNV